MNRSALRCRPWLILLILILVAAVTCYTIKKGCEPFATMAQLPDLSIDALKQAPSTSPSSSSSTDTANQQYASLLLFLQQHPEQLAPLIGDLQKKLFAGKLETKDPIDLTQLTNGGAIFGKIPM